jgi:hypothetical protein
MRAAWILALATAGAFCASQSLAGTISGITLSAGGVISGSISSGSVSISTGTITIGGDPTSPAPPPPFSLSDPEFLDLAPGASVQLDTTQDILVLDMDPSSGTRDSVRLRAGTTIDFENPGGFEFDLSGLTPTLCEGDACLTSPLASTRDVVVRFSPTLANVDLRAGGEILYLTPLAPEPSALALLAVVGGVMLSVRRH